MNSAFSRGTAAILLMAALGANVKQAAAQLRLNAAEVEGGSQAELPPPEQPYRDNEATMPYARPSLGITLDPQFRDAVVVRSVRPGGAADLAGLQRGDTIEALNGNRVETYRDVQDFIDALRPGDILDIDFSRRITGRTQAVLDSQPQDRSRTIYQDRNMLRSERTEQAAYEELPSPPYAQDRMPDTASRPVLDPRSGEPYDDRAARRDEPEERRGRLFDREPRDRGRALLPWRRN